MQVRVRKSVLSGQSEEKVEEEKTFEEEDLPPTPRSHREQVRYLGSIRHTMFNH